MDKVTLKPGDVIAYAGEDAGGVFYWDDPDTGAKRGWSFTPTYAHLEGRKPVEDEKIVVDTDIPLNLCQSLIDNGRCKVLPAVETETVTPAVPAPVAAKDKGKASASSEGG